MRLALLSLLLLVVACSSDKPSEQGGPDASGPVDGGTSGDGGETPDAGGDDGGTSGDGGSADGGTSEEDGGSTGEEDAGNCEEPAPQRETVLVPGLNNPRRLAADTTDLFISESHSLRPLPDDGEGQVLRLSRQGGEVAVLAKGFRSPDAIAVDAKNVYVLDQGGLWRVDRSTGERGAIPIEASVNNVIAGGTDVRAAKLSGRDVVVVATGAQRLVRVDTVGATPSSLILFEGPKNAQVRGARVDGETVWFLVSGGSEPGLYRVGLDGNSSAERIFPGITTGTSLELTGTHFLVTEGGGGTGKVWKLPRAGGDAQLLAEGLQGPLFPVQFHGAVYFKEAIARSPGFLQRIRGGCTTSTLDDVGPQGTGPGGLLVDGDTLLYTSQESGTGGAVGRIP
ncbi:signal integration modulator SinM [Myxococcus sp. K15C18031901]|uniref:signal integration modulator SinM n=1 Tax=Myxococcus dinghuensis TaxID=2906761 RepID=UPI0020A78177|nr:signal integration modulator SinM [Myxococcus dinghuensis]MCP3105389.1 signal integration modulator SinM [Myxococcus dinghuensis]